MNKERAQQLAGLIKEAITIGDTVYYQNRKRIGDRSAASISSTLKKIGFEYDTDWVWSIDRSDEITAIGFKNPAMESNPVVQKILVKIGAMGETPTATPITSDPGKE